MLFLFFRIALGRQLRQMSKQHIRKNGTLQNQNIRRLLNAKTAFGNKIHQCGSMYYEGNRIQPHTDLIKRHKGRKKTSNEHQQFIHKPIQYHHNYEVVPIVLITNNITFYLSIYSDHKKEDVEEASISD